VSPTSNWYYLERLAWLVAGAAFVTAAAARPLAAAAAAELGVPDAPEPAWARDLAAGGASLALLALLAALGAGGRHGRAAATATSKPRPPRGTSRARELAWQRYTEAVAPAMAALVAALGCLAVPAVLALTLSWLGVLDAPAVTEKGANVGVAWVAVLAAFGTAGAGGALVTAAYYVFGPAAARRFEYQELCRPADEDGA
jgi:hypothetical protein